MYKHLVYIICLAALVFIFLLLIKSLNSKKQSTTRIFAATTGITALWIGILWIADTTSSVTLAKICLNIAVPCVSILTSLFLIFAINYPNQIVKKRNTLNILLVIFNLFILCIAFTGNIITRVKITKFGAEIEQSTIYYILHQIQSNISILSGLIVLNIKKRKLDTLERSRIDIMTLGVFVALGANLISGTVVTYIQNFQWFNLVATASVAFFIGSIGYSILKYKLFDVRLIVARAIGYILTLLTLAGGYSFLIYIIFANFSGITDKTRNQQFIYIALALAFGFTLPPLKKFFDRVSNRLFYRDAYEPQELLDELNKVLVGNIELDAILKQTADILAHTIKTEYVAFIIRETEGTSKRASFSKIVELNTDAILALPGKQKGKTELFIADEIENEQDEHKKVMTANNISVAAKLAGSGIKGNQGFMLLGPKQSGNPYNKQDLQVLDIIANELVIAIQNAIRFEEIETFNVTLQEKVDDATKKLRQTNEKLRELDESKDEFISMASHQLRTPLTSVKGYVSMVQEGDAGKLNKQQKELLGQAFTSSQRMVYLIADLLNVSRLKTGKFVIENKPTQLADVIESEMEQLKATAETKNQTLTYKKPDKFPELMLDETKIRQVIMNFTDNALHYTPNDGHIEVKLEDLGKEVQFTVVDDGIGVPKSEQHHMFSKFYRAGNAKKARPDGTGLGLFMAKKVIVAQGGALIFHSEENKGSTFGFTFPKAHFEVTAETKKKAEEKAKLATEPELLGSSKK